MGTMEEALLQDHSPVMETAVTVATEPSRTGVWFRSLVASCLSCRSGDELADGGHMIVQSIGQVMRLMSSASFATSSANVRSGTAHIGPMIWQKAKTRTVKRTLAWTNIITRRPRSFQRNQSLLTPAGPSSPVNLLQGRASIMPAKRLEELRGISIVIPTACDYSLIDDLDLLPYKQ